MNPDFLIVALVLLFLGQGAIILILAKGVRDLVNDSLDTMSKLAQLNGIHQKSKTAGEIVENTIVLERERAALAKAERLIQEGLQDNEADRTQPKKLVGFRGSNGRVIKFMAAPDNAILSRIPKKDLVYE